MAVIQSEGQLQALGGPVASSAWEAPVGSMQGFDGRSWSYLSLMRRQLQVRICLSFLARNIAQLGLKAYSRDSARRRQEQYDSAPARLIRKPNPFMTRYLVLEHTVKALAGLENAYWVKVRDRASGDPQFLFPLPPQYVTPQGGLWPTNYRFQWAGRPWDAPPSEIIHFRTSSLDSPLAGTSPLEALRRVLGEDEAAGEFSEGSWRNGIRAGGFIERPKDAPRWEPATRDKFRSQFAEHFSGVRASGVVPVLEDGMHFNSSAFSPRDAQLWEQRQLTREEAARAFHIPLPMVGILEHATYSNITEQHKNLYQDCLAPWLTLIEEELERSLLPDFAGTDSWYYEFNLQEKLKGSFEEQAASLASLTGRPIIVVNEARARLNLDPVDGGDDLAVPLNLTVGDQAPPEPQAPAPEAGQQARPKALLGASDADVKAATVAALRTRHGAKWREIVAGHFERQQRAVEVLLREKAAAPIQFVDELSDPSWEKQLTRDLQALGHMTADTWALLWSKRFQTEDTFQPERMAGWIQANAKASATNIHAFTVAAVAAAAGVGDIGAQFDEETLLHVFEVARGARSAEIAASKVTTLSNFGSHEAATQAGRETKSWATVSKNPRPSHSRMSGETVPLDDVFSNGMRYPGDPAGGADEVAGCQCALVFE